MRRGGGGGHVSVRNGSLGEDGCRVVVGFTSFGGWALRRGGGGSFRGECLVRGRVGVVVGACWGVQSGIVLFTVLAGWRGVGTVAPT
jgi:hypothetical protein